MILLKRAPVQGVKIFFWNFSKFCQLYCFWRREVINLYFHRKYDILHINKLYIKNGVQN